MPLSAGLKAKCDTIIDDLVIELATKQFNFKAVRNRYWEGRQTHDTIPADDVPTAPTKTNKQTDFDDWNTFEGGVTLPATMECCAEAIAYKGPGGHGYIVRGIVIEAGQTYHREMNVGPESWRDHDWTEFDPL